jgi:hypothetical protein
MLEIRRMLVAGDNPREVQSKLGLSPRTFWRYIHSIFEKDRQVLRKLNQDEVLIQASILRDRYTDIYRTLDSISKDHTIDPEQRREACADMAGVAKLITKIYTEAPAFVAMQNRKREQEAEELRMKRLQQGWHKEMVDSAGGGDDDNDNRSKFDPSNTEFVRNIIPKTLDSESDQQDAEDPRPGDFVEEDQQEEERGKGGVEEEPINTLDDCFINNKLLKGNNNSCNI